MEESKIKDSAVSYIDRRFSVSYQVTTFQNLHIETYMEGVKSEVAKEYWYEQFKEEILSLKESNEELLIPFPPKELECRDGKEIKVWMKGWEEGVLSQEAKEYWSEFLQKENKLTYQQFLEQWEQVVLPRKEKHIREGQCLMNYLGEKWIEEYKRISSLNFYDQSNIDCFYNDRLIPNTLKHLEKVWDQYPN